MLRIFNEREERNTEGYTLRALQRGWCHAHGNLTEEVTQSLELKCCHFPCPLPGPAHALQPYAQTLTLSANTTLKRIMVGASLLGDGSVFETCKRDIILMNERYQFPGKAVYSISGMGEGSRM